MRVAIANDNGNVGQHFGHCERFTVFEVENDKIISNSILNSPKHEHGIMPQFLFDNGLNVVIVGGMGEGAKNKLNVFNINYFVGINSTVDEAIDLFLNNELKSDDKACTEHKYCNH